MKTKNIFLAKFGIVAVMVGLFSPTVQVERINNTTDVSVSLLQQAEARRGGARRGGNRNVNRNRNSNRNVNRNVNRNRNVNVNVNHYGGGYHGRHYGYYHGAPILAFATVVAIGSVVAASTMPTTCTTVVVNGLSYRRCDNAYYQPFYQGDTLVYKSVNSPY